MSVIHVYARFLRVSFKKAFLTMFPLIKIFELHVPIYLFIYLFLIFVQGSPFTDRWSSMGP